jgi:hypothetical protein
MKAGTGRRAERRRDALGGLVLGGHAGGERGLLVADFAEGAAVAGRHEGDAAGHSCTKCGVTEWSREGEGSVRNGEGRKTK